MIPSSLRVSASLCHLLACAFVLAACGPPADDDDSTTAPGAPFEIGPEVPCPDPHDGVDRWREVGEERGLVEVMFPDGLRGGDDDDEDDDEFYRRAVVLEDLDADGDLDLLTSRADGLPFVSLNDGAGSFTPGPALPPAPADDLLYFGVADLDGDGFVDLVGHRGHGGLYVAMGDGAGGFGDVLLVEGAGGDERGTEAIVLGDVDLDGDVDALTITSHFEDEDPSAEPLELFLNDGAGALALAGRVDAVTSQAATLTDRDRDGDPDLFVLTNAFEGAAASVLLDHDGTGWTTDVAPALNADVTLVAMGVDSGDLDGDGAFDYCASDLGPPVCLFSAGGGTYVDGAAAAGLHPDAYPYDHPPLSGWSMDFADVDADGHLDVLHASGWDDVEPHYGMGVGDVDGDGSVEAVLAGPFHPPRLQLNRCAPGAWVIVELDGAPPNTTALGAVVEATLPDGRVLFREVLGPRAQGQSASQVHFGLGDGVDTLDRLVVRWPTGTVTEATGVPVRRRIRASER